MLQGVNIEIVDITKRYASTVIFEHVSVSVTPGECLAIVGKNGSGKSTLLKIIAGILRPSSGCVKMTVGNKELSVEEKMQVIGMVSPEVIFYNTLSGLENILFLLQARGIDLALEEMKQCLVMAGLDRQCNTLVASYSTGMRQRLKLAALLALRPQVWLLDEPSSNLDEEGKKLVSEILTSALLDKATVVLATNESWEAEHGSKKVILA
jgi:heme exporter protein A